MALKITPGPLPNDGTRINVQTVLTAFVTGTTIENVSLQDFESGAEAAFIVSQTDAPATASRTRATIWFQRGPGRLLKWTAVPDATDQSDRTGYLTSNQSEFHWVQIGGERREHLAHLAGGVASEHFPLMVNTTFTQWRHVRSTDNQYTMSVRPLRNQVGGMGMGFVFDPVLVNETTVTGPEKIFPAADWGFVRARVAGAGRFCILTDLHATSGTDTTPNTFFMCTTHSVAGIRNCIVGHLVESSATDGLRIAEVFLRPQITNIVHGDNS